MQLAYAGSRTATLLETRNVNSDEALEILNAGPHEMPVILESANGLRVANFGNRVHLCSIVNARSGACSEDCAYCAQSAHHDTEAEIFDLKSPEAIVECYQGASELPISHFGVVTSGPALTDDSLDRIGAMIKDHKDKGDVNWCSSLGCLSYEQLVALKDAGMSRFHHNLETAESFFGKICTTHTYAERLETVRAAKKAGLEVCCGGILGMGESLEQRVEFALTLSREGVTSIPLNFLVPVQGTRLGNLDPMEPLEILKSIAMFRMTNPTAEIKVCAGRQHLRNLQSMIFYAGATGMLIGPLLTVAGCNVEDDLQMIEDLGLDAMSHES